MTMTEYKKWEYIYDYLVTSGWGFPVGLDDDDLVEAAERDGYEVIERIDGPDGGFVLARHDGGRVILVADMYGPWAVDVTRYMPAQPGGAGVK